MQIKFLCTNFENELNKYLDFELIVDEIRSNLAFKRIMKKQNKKTSSNPTVENLRKVFKEKQGGYTSKSL